MLPLNKPYINRKRNKTGIDDFVQENFQVRQYMVTSSTRQALSLIYRNIFEQYGRKKVAVSPLVCYDALFPIIENGHEIHFIDINPETFNMDESKIPENFDIVQPVHFGGFPQDLDKILQKKPWITVEDCAQGLGTTYNNKQIGLHGDFSVFSFLKNTYSLGGGLLLNNSDINISCARQQKFSNKATFYRMLKRSLEARCTIDNDLFSRLLKTIIKLKPEHTSSTLINSGNNDMIIRSVERQLAIFETLYNKRIHNARYLLSRVENANIIAQKAIEGSLPNYNRLNFLSKNRDSKDVISFLRKKGIGANHLTQNFVSPYQERIDKNPAFKSQHLGQLEQYYQVHDRIFSVPISPAIKSKELDYICMILNTV